MITTLQNDVLRIDIAARGAELRRIVDADGCDYLWSGDPAIWPERSPLLFPVVGGLWQDVYRLNETVYRMGRHGFARHSDFELLNLTGRQARYVLTDSPATRAVYPFAFRLEVEYDLHGNSVTTEYRISHSNPGPLPFSIGAHPGFLCRWEPGDRIDQYYLEWEHVETATAHVLQNGYRTGERRNLFDGTRRLPLSVDLFAREALVFTDHTSRRLRLCRYGDSRYVEVDFPGFPHLGIWSRPGAPFVCIEPWFGYSDAVGYDGEVWDKPGIQRLAPGARFVCRYSIRLAPVS